MPYFILIARIRLLGIAAIIIALFTWGMDLGGWVYECPYCRTLRTIIGVLGVLMTLPSPHHWLSRYFGSVLAAYGLPVGVMSSFDCIEALSDGIFELTSPWYMDSFPLSIAAMFIITGQILLLYQSPVDRSEKG